MNYFYNINLTTLMCIPSTDWRTSTGEILSFENKTESQNNFLFQTNTEVLATSFLNKFRLRNKNSYESATAFH